MACVTSDALLIVRLLRHFWPSLLLITIPAALSLSLARAGWSELGLADALLTAGNQTRASIVAVHVTGERRTPRYALDYEFRTARGEVMRQRGPAMRDQARHASPGDRPQLWYLAHDPARHSLDPLGDRARALRTLGLAGAFALITLGAGVVLGRPVVSAARALRSAQVRLAQVTAHATRPGPRGAPLPVLEWRDAAGATGWVRLGEYQRPAQFPVGSWSIQLARDPVTGRDWWLADF